MAESALMMLDRHLSTLGWQEELRTTMGTMLDKDNHYTLFRSEDWPAWVTFSVVFVVLIIFDNVFMGRHMQNMSIKFAVLYTMFWVFMASAFCGWVYWWYSPAAAFMWMSGYLLEWMLSFDNLFVFHLIFNIYGTPDHLKHKALFLGICGAVFFRVAFIFIGEYLMHSMFFMHFVFGAFLVYTGVKTMYADEDDEDPSQHPLVQMLQQRVPFVGIYDQGGAFFVRVPVDENGRALMPELEASGPPGADASSEATPFANCNADTPTPSKKVSYGTIDFEKALAKLADVHAKQRYETRATMLVLVVCCLEISDILFAVDSVSAIVAQVNDLFLAYTSAVFAMLGLRATFFIIDVLVKLFSMLKYGVGAVLVFVGIKLCIGRWYHVHPAIVCAVLFLAIGGSMVASVIKEKYFPDEDSDDEEKASLAGSAKQTPVSSPIVPARRVTEVA
eukprot:TRINITY_DN103490_c0_g1_i1.p1 TRINITY_DN103490_c0_g1~~TRINITY_DN103490_c0_g1_i1.p1  ORF type:complete len:446 (+),score=127.87 TRINITY_DN103490_c0_g1_i1:131-1468(+)